MKKLQKGFSLVELLVVVAIIGVLAGVGIVGYSSYTDSAKNRVAIANFNTVKRFVDTELTLLNNNIQTVSSALKQGSACGSMNPLTIHSDPMSDVMIGLKCYFDVGANGYGNAFKNPYDAAGGNQVEYTAAAAAQVKGAINIRPATDGEVVSGSTADTDVAPIDHASSSGWFVVEYYTAKTETGSSGEYAAKLFELK